ncbi:MAG: response regulator [Saprospiraceae bacterium]|nr:response regulator [Saprospiraceae bacterium]
MKNYQIVVVEDSPSDALFTKIALEEIDDTLQIAWLQDGEEAINFLFPTAGKALESTEYQSIKIILLDLNLPRYTGLEVLTKLKSHEETKNIPDCDFFFF